MPLWAGALFSAIFRGARAFPLLAAKAFTVPEALPATRLMQQRFAMAAPDARQRRFGGLARGVRAAILVPALFALALLVFREPKAAGFAVFGTFAHLVMVDYDRGAKARFVESAMLTTLGAVMVTLGALASSDVRLAAGGALARSVTQPKDCPPPGAHSHSWGQYDGRSILALLTPPLNR